MDAAKDRIIEYLASHESVTGKELREHLGISRQALSIHLRALSARGEVFKTGSTRNARYSLASAGPAPQIWRLEATLRDLQEDQVYGRLAPELSLSAQLRQPVEAIVRYAFTEMLNNAIDHSEADQCSILFQLDAAAVSFEIRDKGIGVFHSIASKLGLEDEQAAMIELFKGRTTTQPDQHSGEGIFFTSRAADRFILRSHRIQVEWSSSQGDIFVSRQRFITGTKVSFRIQRGSRRRLEDVFQAFAPAEYDFRFQKTRVHVRLLSKEYVSRSEARRLLLNLEKFSEVALDFTQVRSLGQGFADEIFRVFAAGHPDIKLVIENANPVIAAMLHHVQHTEGHGA